MKPVIVWFRRDLRIHDNPALYFASKTGLPLIPLFIFDKKIISNLLSDGAIFDFQAEALANLNLNLKKFGARLIYKYGNVLEVHSQLIKEVNPQALYFNRDYEPATLERDNCIAKLYQKDGIEIRTFKDSVLIEPDEIFNQQGKPYTVFTPYANSWKKMPLPAPYGYPSGIKSVSIKSEKLMSARELKKDVKIFQPLLKGGESKANKRWEKFLKDILPAYSTTRDIPSVDGTSRMSAYLRFGCISVRQIYEDVFTIAENNRDIKVRASAQKFIDELIWREFYQSVLFHFPHVLNSNFRQAFDRMPWKYDRKLFGAWKNGLTGYPIVDAGIRQLNTTGWMHNRVRMIVASFLTKDLMHDWKLGAKYFEEKLLDIETASNNGGWQWSASTGVDPKPLRIFNPRLQSERFDPNGKYIKRWIPELVKVPHKFIHAPYEIPFVLQKELGCVVGKHYPLPIVDHKKGVEIYKEKYYGMM